MPDEPSATPEATSITTPAQWITVLRQPLSTVQTVVGILAGLLTIGGGFLSFSGITASAAPPQQGEIVAVVHDARSHRPLSQANIEIVTPQDAIVTSVQVEPDGHLARRLKEGRYRLRVTHPGFLTEVRLVEVHAGQRSDVRIALALKPPPPRVMKAVAVVPVEEPGPIEKFFRNLFQ